MRKETAGVIAIDLRGFGNSDKSWEGNDHDTEETDIGKVISAPVLNMAPEPGDRRSTHAPIRRGPEQIPGSALDILEKRYATGEIESKKKDILKDRHEVPPSR